MKYINITLIAIAGVAKAIMDTLQFHFSQCVFKGINDQFWDASISWENKYNSWLPDFLVFLTDGWHLAQFVFLNALFIGLMLYKPIVYWNNKSTWWTKCIDFILLRGVFGLAFVIFYNYILV